MAFDIIAAATAIPRNVPKDDGAIDRLHHQYTVMMIVTFAVIVSAQQYVGSPITCWVPAEFGSGWTKYTNTYCWVKNTYFLAFEDEIPHDWEPQKRDEIVYYQWVPFIFLGQAIFFYIPSVVWHGLNSKAGVDSDNILAAARTFNKAETLNHRKRTLRLIVNQIDRFVKNRHSTSKGFSFSVGSMISRANRLCGKRFGNYLIVLYILVKLLYIGNVVGQIYFLNFILETNFAQFGVTSLMRWADDDNSWINNTVFPKVTMCDFHVRRVGNNNRYTTQCALNINLYIEKMYIILWFWMMLLLILTSLDFISWTLRMALGQDKLRYVQNHLYNMDRLPNGNLRKQSNEFVNGYLKNDGVFLCRLIGHNTNFITVSEVIAGLWDNWMHKLDNDDPNANKEETPLLSPNHRPSLPEPPPIPSFKKPPIMPKPTFGVQPTAPHMNEEQFEDPMYDP